MTAVYNSPVHRGKGIANMLIQSAMDFAGKEGERVQCRVRIMIHPSNVAVKRLYEGLGFVDAGNCTLAEAYVSNGDREMLPLDGGGEYYFLWSCLLCGKFLFWRDSLSRKFLSKHSVWNPKRGLKRIGRYLKVVKASTDFRTVSHPEKYHTRQGIIMMRVTSAAS